MSLPIIEISGIGKKYRIGAHKEPYLSLRDSLARKAKGFTQRFSRLTTHNSQLATHHSEEDFWALRDVSFSVQQGECVGIIGRNGAGKSTLLKILSQITPPTEGKITCRGRIASLLEVGTGFHPELTGRENIFLNGAILGMTRAEIRCKFDEIVAFSEVEQFLDTPVKRYSSGMYVRLAFAVAAHLEPEILVVDEVLAVGDAQFQTKCLGKMSEVAKGGRTVLFVSHNMAAVETLCSRAVLLHQGGLRQIGVTNAIIQQYLGAMEVMRSMPLAERTDRQGNGGIRFTSIDIYGAGATSHSTIAMGGEANIRLNYEVSRRHGMEIIFHVSIYNTFGVRLVYVNTKMTGYTVVLAEERGSLEVKMPRLPLSSGRYRVDIGVTGDNVMADKLEGAAMIDVMEGCFYNSFNINCGSGWGGVLVDHMWSAG